MVGSLILPTFCERYAGNVRVVDLRPPTSVSLDAVEYIEGSVTDFDALTKAVSGFGEGDVLVYMAMGPVAGWGDPANVSAHFDAGVKGVHLTLDAAVNAGIRHIVYTGSLSAYNHERGAGERFFSDEDLTPDAYDFYGLTKRFGETICEAFCRRYPGFTVNALRLCLPRPLTEWQEQIAQEPDGYFATIATAGPDVASAYLLAAQKRFGGFEAFTISGDTTDRRVSLRKAKALLGWEPRYPTPAKT